MSEGTINIGDLVTRKYAKEMIGVVTRVKEHDTGMDIYDVYYVDWFDNIKQKPPYPYEAKELVLYEGANGTK
jgi:hypothetical protein